MESTCPNVTYGMPEKASLQQGKLLQPRNIPCGALAKNPNSSKIRSPGMQNTSQKNSPNITFGILKKQQFCRQQAFPMISTWPSTCEKPEQHQDACPLRTLPLESKKTTILSPVRCLSNDLATWPWETLRKTRTLPTECLKQLVSSRKNLGEHLPERYLRNARKS